MAMTCPSCGRRAEPDSRFCAGCGSPLEDRPAPASMRKLATLVFTDVSGSTAMAERLDPEAVREVMAHYFSVARAVLESHGGTVEKFVGDAVMAAFGIPTLREDDALRAVRAAIDLRDAVKGLNEDLETRYGVTLEVRTGVNSGEVIAGDPAAREAFVSGDPVNVAARLEQAAPVGQILIGETTRSLVRDAIKAEAVEPLELKGKSEPVAAYLLEAVETEDAAHFAPTGPALVGRERELSALERSFEAAASERRCGLVTVYAEPGTGKTRLAQELELRVAERVDTIWARCSSGRDTGSLWPLKRALERHAGVLPTDERADAVTKLQALAPEAADRIGPMLDAFGLTNRPGDDAEAQVATRACLEAMAAV